MDVHPLLKARRRVLGAGLAGAGLLLASGVQAHAPRSEASVSLVPTVGEACVLPGVWQFETNAFGAARRVFVACPETPAPAAGYPVLYVLDGNALFPLLAQQLRLRAARPESAPVELPLIVGLGYPGNAVYNQEARAIDYTLLPVGEGADKRPGAARFLDFIEHAVQPALQANFSVDTARTTIFGHSYGGLCCVYALLSRASLFRNYVAASPSLWWGERAIFERLERFINIPPGDAVTRHLMLTVGDLEESDRRALTPRERRQSERKMIGNARALIDGLASVDGLRSDLRLLPDADHGSVVLPSSALALRIACGEFA